MRPRRPPGGFTVVELVVVVAIISLLLSILVPSLASVRASGRGAVCVSNLRQMAIAAQTYALEYQFFPPAMRYENDGEFTNVAWDWITTSDRVISPGPLWQFTDDPDRVQQCPEYGGETNFAERFTGYNYNTTHVASEWPFPHTGWGPPFRPGVRYGACRRTARVAVFGDGGWAGGTNKLMRAPMNAEEDLSMIYAGGQAFRHQKTTTVAYLDCHVGIVTAPARGRLATDTLLEDKMDYPHNGFLSDDDTAYDPR
jgi:prepilin-type N-terminal cleavage/methylation domain-containing protein/prepilin-type processing-associated H-X9-DG protein